MSATLRNARSHLIAERRELLALCHALGPAEWEAASLCAGWRVRDVVAHVIGGERDWADILRTHGDVDAANARSVERRAGVPVQQLLAELDEIAAVQGLGRLFAPVLLVDNWIHQEDIRRPIGRPRAQNPDRLRWVLRWTRVLPSGRGRSLRLVATDLDYTAGEGPEVRGAAADIIMAVAGRASAARHLEGAGVECLLA
ncbi:MAG TPA: maleylpyruvate isomerase family mycothiol-dependent enzyme [Chloroflexota bacterium]|nr:maleylpyruvate isomerase family mycothiol-dependent enzyme [Chloroflexota bacterium]